MSFISLEAHLSCGAGILLKSFSVTHSCFPGEEKGHMAKGCSWAACLLVIPTAYRGQSRLFVNRCPHSRR